jgi:hypothetical protein
MAVCLLSISPVQLQAQGPPPAFKWAVKAGGPFFDDVSGLDVDSGGNCYVVGENSVRAVFGTNLFDEGLFVAKYDNTGSLVWARHFGGNVSMIARGDLAGNCYVTGAFGGHVDFGGTTLPNSGDTRGEDVFVAKYDQNGKLLWARQAGGEDDDVGLDIAVDALGNCYITGSFKSQFCAFDSITLTNQSFYGGGFMDIFVAKYDSAGKVLWAKAGGAAYTACYADRIRLDAAGNIYIAGELPENGAEFDGSPIPDGSPIFLAKLRNTGELLWAERVDVDYESALAVTSSGDCFLTGGFSGTVSFGSLSVTNITNGTYITDAIYLVKYDSNGQAIWVKQSGPYGPAGSASSVAADSSGDCFLVGQLLSTNGNFDGITLPSPETGWFVTKLDPVGNVLWLRSMALGFQTYFIFQMGVGVDSSGNCYLLGAFTSTNVVFDQFTLVNNGLTNGTPDIFLAALGLSPPKLNIQFSPGAIMLSWPTNYGGFTLEFTTDPAIPNSWSSFAESPGIVGLDYTFTNAFSVSNRFYRLKRP